MKYSKLAVLSSVLVFLAIISCDRKKNDVILTDITGVYTCQESSPYSGIRNYFIEIDKIEDEEGRYIISNFHSLGDNEFIFADFRHDTLRISGQVVAGFRVNGSGPVANDFRLISLYYEMDDGLSILDYYVTYRR